MAIITIQGRVHKRGSGEHGEWAVVREQARKRDGDTYEVSYMCGAARNESVPSEGAQVVVTGYGYAKVREYEGKHYGDIALNGAKFVTLEAGAPTVESVKDELGASEIPF